MTPPAVAAGGRRWHHARPMRRAALLGLLLLLAGPRPAPGASSGLVVRRVGGLIIRADQTLAFPGGLVSVQLQSSRPIGSVAYAVLDGRRCPFFYRAGTLTALVPIPATLAAGPVTLGLDIRGRRGRQRISVPLEIAPRQYP